MKTRRRAAWAAGGDAYADSRLREPPSRAAGASPSKRSSRETSRQSRGGPADAQRRAAAANCGSPSP
eukprot:CAMPEP_0184230228 /NCGR_PEP_ID=MMETSP0976-20121227/22664_1 /TAXON_ID=483370 /ORGANISM="non described non described, Strain CCMP2097" /LENGTH=66 /DNA_ID=CAMNT_0026535211 /DNA_START=201 /DNA_END=397 /DNA_ORIENTATION=+